MRKLKQTVLLCASLALAACSPSEEETEKACYDKLSADLEASRLFAREQSQTAAFGSDEALAWSQYAVTAAKSALSISVIYSDDDQNACDYVSDGPTLKRK